MYRLITTKEQAKKYVYGKWAGNPKGTAYKDARCAYAVWPRDGWVEYQCGRKPGYGPDQLYCKQHAKMVEKRLAGR